MNLSNQAIDLLQDGLNKLNLTLDIEPFIQYILLLDKWNQAYNLTAVRDKETMITRHILDSLAILPWLKGPKILDVGSGAGLPGIPIALAKPDFELVLLDSNGKKVRFLQEVVRRLKLTQVSVIQSRAESYHPSFVFDTVTSRAFSDLSQMLQWTNHLLGTHGVWLAMKGRYPETELLHLNKPYRVNQYTVPGLDSERCAVIIENVTKE
ncbi:MAG: 16S rRNA (guanine(527)-N(7))-methyltransferase RsmG [Tatlockia sp.]|jgi:16S rRNA (guanine527-N7)-methyltransferase